MRKIIAILLLVFLTAPFWGTYIFLQHNRNKIKKEVAGMIRKGLGKKDLVLLKFTKKETETVLSWKHAGEFEYNGQMFDIVEKFQEGDTIFYNCYKDYKETRLNNKQKLLVARALGHDPYQKAQTEKIKSFFKTIFRQDIFTWKAHIPQISTSQISYLVSPISSIAPSPPSPPPKAG